MVLGAVSASLSAISMMQHEISKVREKSEFPQDSLQWKNITERKINDYKALIDLFCAWNSEHALDFTAATFYRRKFKHQEFNDGDSEVAYQKWLCSVYLAIGKKYEWPEDFAVWHGRRESKFKLPEILSILNSRAAKKVRYNYLPYSSLEYLDPSAESMLQMNDVLLGAVSWHWNPGMRKNHDSPKSQIARYMQSNCCARDLGRKTPMSMPHLDIWEFRLS